LDAKALPRDSIERPRTGTSDGTGRLGDLRLLLRLLHRARAYRVQIVGVLLIGLLASPLALLEPIPLKIAVDNVLGGHPLPWPLTHVVPASSSGTGLLLLSAGLLIVIALATQLQQLLASLLRTWTGERLVLDFRAELFGHVQRLAFARFDARGTADSIYRIQYDAQVVQAVAVDTLVPLASSAVTVAGMIYVAAIIDVELALVALGVCPLLLLATGAMRQRLRRRNRELKVLESNALSVIQEVLGAIRVVSAFGQEDRERRRFHDRSMRGLESRVRLVLAEGALGAIVGLITAGGMAAAVFVGVLHVQGGLITLGELLIVLGYLAQLYVPLTTMSRKAGRLQTNLAGAERAFALLDQLPDVTESPQARPLARAVGRLELQGVEFGYEPD
jgi:ATP-binding cassette subfamily B protein